MNSHEKHRIQIEFLISDMVRPNDLNELKHLLFCYGLELNPRDKLFYVGRNNNLIELQADTLSFLATDELNLKFLIRKYEKEQTLCLYKPYESTILKNDLEESFLSKYEDSSENLNLKELLKSFPTIKKTDLSSSFYKNSADMSFHQSEIASDDTYFINILKNYSEDFMKIINNPNENTEKEIQTFYNYLSENERYNHLLLEVTSFFERNFVIEKMNIIHSLLIKFNEYKNTKINELLKSIKTSIEKVKVYEFNIKDQKVRNSFYKQNLEKNQSFFNQFLLEIEDNLLDLGFDYSNNNFEPDSFDSNLTKIFTYILKLIREIIQIQTDHGIKIKPLKTDKYLNSSFNYYKLCKKHLFCSKQDCKYILKRTEEGTQSVYNAGKLYDV
jgi:hypothetical protein